MPIERSLQQRHGIGEADRERAAQLAFPMGPRMRPMTTGATSIEGQPTDRFDVAAAPASDHDNLAARRRYPGESSNVRTVRHD